MYSNLAFAITLLGIFSIFELSKGNQKISLIKYHFIARLILLSAGSFFDYLELAGFKNTSIIIAVQSGTYTPAYDGAEFAAAVCNEYSVTIDGVTYGDWYLPSKHELNLLFLQRTIVGNFPNVSGSYWSSTEYFRSDLVGSHQLAWYQNFVTGAQAYLNKKNTWSVRAIRAF
jgi:hypothetical protein